MLSNMQKYKISRVARNFLPYLSKRAAVFLHHGRFHTLKAEVSKAKFRVMSITKNRAKAARRPTD